MQVTTKLREAINLWGSLNAIGSKAFNVRVAYAISKNKQVIQKEIEALNEALKPSEGYNAFEKERISLAKTHSKKDGNGRPVTQQTSIGEVFVMEDQTKYDALLSELKEKHKAAVEEHEGKLQQREEMLEDDITLELHGIKLTDLPETMSVNEIGALSLFIIEDESSKNKAELSLVKE